MKKRLDLFSFNKEDFKIDFICIKENLKVGLPMAFFQSLLAISFLIVQSALNSLGSQEVAAYTAAYKMDSLMMQMLAGFGTAMSTYTAQNYGQHAFERIKEGSKSMLVITITLSIVVTIMAHLFNKQFMMLFVSKKEIEVIHLGMNYISFLLLGFILFFIVRFVLTGLGETFIPLIVGILEVIVRCLGTYFLVYPLGFTGMTYINPLCWITSTFLICCLYPYLLHKAFNGK